MIMHNIPSNVSDFNVGIGTTVSITEPETPLFVGVSSHTEYKSFPSKSFQAWKDTLVKEPEGDIKKNFSVISIDEDAWKYIHELLIADGTSEQYIPSEAITCIDEQQHSKTRSIYLLTPTEVSEIKKHPKIKTVNICYTSYPGTYKEDPQYMRDYEKPNRYDRDSTRTIKNYRDDIWNYLPANPTTSDLNRCGYQLKRCMQKDDPWNAMSDNSILTQSISYYGDGKDVDLIVCDDACWFMHTEFVKTETGIGTHNYIPGNVLNSSTNEGTCGVLDLVLDAPYYIDPDWFDAVPEFRLMERWDGTTVPVESAARAWWTNTTSRSSTSIMGGATVNLNSETDYTRDAVNGGNNITTRSLDSDDDHGTPCASLAYGRTLGWAFNANKWFISRQYIGLENSFDIQKLFHKYKPNRASDNTKNPTLSSNSWAWRSPLEFDGVYAYRENISGYYYYNSINSSDNIITTSGANIGYINYKDHPYYNNYKLKYVAYDKNAGSSIGGLTDGNEYWVGRVDKDTFYLSNTRGAGSNAPTTKISLTSQGVGKQTFGLVSYNTGGGDISLSSSGTLYSGITYNSNTTPKFMSNFNQRMNDGTDGNPVDNRAAIRMEMVDNSITTAGEEMIDEGVIFVCSAGNTNQKLVSAEHPDYNNYWYTGTDLNKSLNETTFTYGYEWYRTINRPGFPQQIGKKWDGAPGALGKTIYRTITIGALNDNFITISGGDTPLPIYEQKAWYSNMGNFVRCFAPGTGVLAASISSSGEARYDDNYTIGSNTAVDSKDTTFSGTSAACPVAAGLIATKLQYQRNWTYDDVMFWIDSMPELYGAYDYGPACDDSGSWPDLSNCASTSKFWAGWEGAVVDSSSYEYWFYLQGSPAKVIWDQQTMAEYGPLQSDVKLRVSGSNLTITGGADGLSLKSG